MPKEMDTTKNKWEYCADTPPIQLGKPKRFVWTFGVDLGMTLGRGRRRKGYLLKDPNIESLPAGFSGFSGHRRAPHQKLQKVPIEI